jgi:hypothetical protein
MLTGSDNFHVPVLSIAAILVLIIVFSGLIISNMIDFPGVPVPSISNLSH